MVSFFGSGLFIGSESLEVMELQRFFKRHPGAVLDMHHGAGRGQ
jgi:hypothetical protein